ncbi:hypothetical protein ACE1B6_27930 [Aerosakkonemataceae cyanobacterium BLCC-F154]|uniref:Uncharacterized protein n=1 Tax=Floridaenema fluviatile BLCC-F154 TaxID=3153640 RepID=A0ABV4YJT9_9CYAN
MTQATFLIELISLESLGIRISSSQHSKLNQPKSTGWFLFVHFSAALLRIQVQFETVLIKRTRVLGNGVSPVRDPKLKSEICPQNWLLIVGRDTLMNGVNILEKQHPSQTSDYQMGDVEFYAAKLGVKFWAPNGKPSVFSTW